MFTNGWKDSNKGKRVLTRDMGDNKL